MARYYKPKGLEIPYNLYMQLVFLVKDYERMTDERGALIAGENPSREYVLNRYIAAVDHALNRMPEEYRRAVYSSIAHDAPRPADLNIQTFKYYRRQVFKDIRAYLGLL